MNVDLPWLNSPSTTTEKRSSSSLGRRVSRTSRATQGSPAASAAAARSVEHGADGRLLARPASRCDGVLGHHSTAISSATRASHSSFDVPAGSASAGAPAARPVPTRLRK